MPVEKKQIEEWKAKFGQVFEIEFEDGLKCWLRKPKRQEVSLAMAKARTNPLGLGEVIVENCWLGGDEEVKRDPGYLVKLTELADQLIGVKSAEIKNC